MFDSPLVLTLVINFFISCFLWASRPEWNFGLAARFFFAFPFWSVLLIFFTCWLIGSIRDCWLFRLVRTSYTHSKVQQLPTYTAPAPARVRADPIPSAVSGDIASAAPVTPRSATRFQF